MAEETRIIAQRPDEEFYVGLSGQTPDSDGCIRPIVHQARMTHEPSSSRPFVHMVCWDREAACALDHSGQVVHVGDPDRPVPLEMRHSTAEPVRVQLGVSEVDHGLTVRTGLAEPIHHALQLKTPVQLRFVNPWEAQSEYTLNVSFGERKVITFHLSGKTTLTPQPAPTDPCASLAAKPTGSPVVKTMADLSGRRTV